MVNITCNRLIIKTNRCEFGHLFWTRRVHLSSAVRRLHSYCEKNWKYSLLHELYDSCCVLRGRNDAELFRRSLQYRGTKKLQSARLSNLKSDSTRVSSGFWTSNLQSTVVVQFGICLNNYFKRHFMQLSRVWLGYCSTKFVLFPSGITWEELQPCGNKPSPHSASSWWTHWEPQVKWISVKDTQPF